MSISAFDALFPLLPRVACELLRAVAGVCLGTLRGFGESCAAGASTDAKRAPARSEALSTTEEYVPGRSAAGLESLQRMAQCFADQVGRAAGPDCIQDLSHDAEQLPGVLRLLG